MKKYREAKGVTQHQAYSDTGIHFGRIEQGERDVSLTTLLKITNYLQVSVGELVD
ncbi:MAG: helix-turn-helix transcriptional regulator [Crocinitomicaceae bacterium]